VRALRCPTTHSDTDAACPNVVGGGWWVVSVVVVGILCAALVTGVIIKSSVAQRSLSAVALSSEICSL
jgi:hypothetical protein